jgi:hypothetical protein
MPNRPRPYTPVPHPAPPPPPRPYPAPPPSSGARGGRRLRRGGGGGGRAGPGSGLFDVPCGGPPVGERLHGGGWRRRRRRRGLQRAGRRRLRYAEWVGEADNGAARRRCGFAGRRQRRRWRRRRTGGDRATSRPTSRMRCSAPRKEQKPSLSLSEHWHCCQCWCRAAAFPSSHWGSGTIMLPGWQHYDER